MLGANDLAYLTSPSQTIAALRTYINRARAAHPGIDVVVGEVVNRWDPWSRTYTLTSESAQYATLLASLASGMNSTNERVVVAQTRSGWDAAQRTYDGTHPNPTGEALMAQHLSNALARLGIGTAAPDVSGLKTWNVAGPPVALTRGVNKVDHRGGHDRGRAADSLLRFMRTRHVNGGWPRRTMR